MFQATLDFDDLGAPLTIVSGALLLGASSIRPLDHRMVRWRALASASRVVVIAAERFSDDQAASGTLRQADDTEIDAAIAAIDDYLLDFAVLLIDRRDARIAYRASPVVSVPAYIHSAGRTVLIDWDYARLLRQVTIRPALDIVLAGIAGRSLDDTRTVVDGLHRLTADTTVIATRAGLEIRYPAAVEHHGPGEIAPDADPGEALFAAVCSIIAARPLSAATTAVDVSGGMDSALTALAAAQVIEGDLLSVGARFRGAMGMAQAERRRLIVEQGGFDDIVVPAERFTPFAPGTARRFGPAEGRAVLPDDENYPELFETIFGVLRAAGVDTLISGLGGDELYALYEGEEARRFAPDVPLPFLSDDGWERAMAIASDYPVGWLQSSSWASAAARSHRLLRFGLWPVYPYINVALARFVGHLPYRYRRDRALLRQLLSKLLGNPVYETDYRKERFGVVARRGIAENRAYLREMVRGNPLRALPEIDGDAILCALDAPIFELDKPVFEGLFRALKTFAFFAPS